MPLAQVSEQGQRILDEVERAVVGKRQPLTLVLSAILAGGHVLIEDFPGLGKTLAARCFATDARAGVHAEPSSPPTCCPATSPGRSSTTSARRSSRSGAGRCSPGCCSPTRSTARRRRPSRRCSRRCRSSQVTVEGQTFPLARPFHVLATANPVEYEGTYPLPEAQLDRFLMRVSFGYPSESRGAATSCATGWPGSARRSTLDRVTDAAGLLAMQDAVETVTVDDTVAAYCVALAAATRDHQHAMLGRVAPRLAGPDARRRGRTPSSAAATTSPPRTSRRWRSRSSRTGSPSSPSCG